MARIARQVPDSRTRAYGISWLPLFARERTASPFLHSVPSVGDIIGKEGPQDETP
jgi:hypothetical protein